MDRRRRPRRVRDAALATGLALVVVACGGADGSPGPRASTAATGVTVGSTPPSAPTATGRDATAEAPSTRPPSRAHATADPAVVVTDRGPVRGAADPAVRRFLGVPFAAPPVGDRRWRMPEPPAPWTDERAATAPAPMCAQIGRTTSGSGGAEDCLYLDVYAPPAGAGGNATDGTGTGRAGAPVLVWFHGGGFTMGSPGFTDGATLAARYGLVVVTPAYRLGPLGFVGLDELADEDPSHSTGSYGLADQQRALEWVRDNASAFGGDPGNVTIAGESAGGWSVCAHLASPRSAGLFHRAVVESGPCTMPLVSPARSRRQGTELAAALGCAPAGRVDLVCLRAKPPEAVLAALPDDGVFGLRGGTRWGPTVDGWMLTEQPRDAVAAGRTVAVPLLIGWNADEGRLFDGLAYLQPGRPPDAAAYTDALVAFTGGDHDTADAIAARYPLARYPDAGEAFAAVLGDATLKCPGRAVAEAWAAAGRPVWVYSFTYPRATFQVPISGYPLGAFHSAEIQFVFDTPLKSDDPVEQQLGREMAGRWAQFARTGDPNGAPGLATAWPGYGAPERPHLVFDEQVSTGTALDQQSCTFWDSLDDRWAPR